MKLIFEDKTLEKIYLGEMNGAKGFPSQIIRSYKKVLNLISNANDILDLQNMQSLRLKECNYYKLGHYVLRINDQFRLIVKIEDNIICIVCEVKDYHDRI